MFVRLLDPRTGELLREHLGQKRGGHRIRDRDRPRRTPPHIFKDPMTTAAAIDRLVHHCVILELNIPSYPMEQAKKNRDSATDTGEAS
jgi:hypothetical protein